MDNFSCHTEYEMESSKVHYSELSYSTDSEWSAESNREHFELLKKHPQYGRFFRDFDTLMLGEKISAGAQAEIYEGRLQPNVPFDLVVKVMMGDAPLQAFQSQWPVGMLSAHSRFKLLFDLPLITIMGGTLLEDARFAFVMYRRWGDLRLLIDRRMKHTNSSPFPIEQAIQLMRSIAEDMKTLHEKHDILHRDLKASNVLIWGDFAEDVSLVTTTSPSEKINTVVADFECSVGVLGTGLWRAPEIIQQLRERVRASEVKFTRASDVYSFGMTCYEIATGCIPFDGDCNEEMVSKVLVGLRPKLPRDLPEFLSGIIVHCWFSDPSQRPNFSEICGMLEERRSSNPANVVVSNEIVEVSTVVMVMHPFEAEDTGELSLSVGDYVVVHQVSPTGWSEGECRGRAGWFPSSYVKKRQRIPASKVTHSFEAEDEGELSLSVGDYVVVRQVSPTGWSEGECRGRRGWFPSSYVQKGQSM